MPALKLRWTAANLRRAAREFDKQLRAGITDDELAGLNSALDRLARNASGSACRGSRRQAVVDLCGRRPGEVIGLVLSGGDPANVRVGES